MEAKSLKTIIRELDQYAPMIDDTQVETVAKMVFQANRIFIGGAGRSGFAGRGFAHAAHAFGIARLFCRGNHDPINWGRRPTCDRLWFRIDG